MILFSGLALLFLCLMVFLPLFLDSPGVAVAGLVCWLLIGGWLYYASWGTKTTETIIVEGTERIAEDNDGKWVVYEKDGETFQNTDAWFQGKTNSTDLQRQIKAGHTYRCEVNGFRFTLLSWYRNILDCDEVPS